MFKTFVLFVILLPLSCFAQIAISGRVLSKVDNKPAANASVFLSNATIGAKTADDGTFTLRSLKPGKYDLVVSIVGFDTYNQTIVVGDKDISLSDIVLTPKSNVLSEVTIKVKRDPYRSRNLDWFKADFLGTSYLARECTILNPDKLDLDYDDATGVLTASSYDFLVIENPELGYRIKYLLADFTSNLKDSTAKKVYYKGSVLYEEMKGTPAQEKRWRRNRQEVYETSAMHFLRAAAADRVADEGFRVLKYSVMANPARPADPVIDAKIKLFKDISPQRDSLSYWVKKSKLPRTLQKLLRDPMKAEEFVTPADQPGLYNLMCSDGALYVTYNKNRRFSTRDRLEYLEDPRNTENSLINFGTPNVLFYKNGVIANPYSVLYNGAWGRSRLADLLPVDYEALPEGIAAADSTAAEKAVARMTAFADQHPSEKSYLHFDKPYYAAGDTLYFKAYVTIGEDHRLSVQNGVLHVDLINTADKIDRSIKLQLVDGISWGDFALPDSLPKGNYRVRAYTNLMRNEGNGAYFEQVIPVGSNHVSKAPAGQAKNAVAADKARADIQFFPEGGQMVAGIRSKIAFKAIGPNGAGIAVKGTIVDNENKEVAAFTSEHLGMGYFYLTPQQGRYYKANVTYADSTTATTDLPKAEEKGIVLSVNNDSLPKASVKIEASKAVYDENKGKEYSLLIYSGGVAATVSCKLDEPVITLDILKRRLHTGVATLTLFSPNGEPLCERLIFVQKYDQLDLSISTNKSAYTKREKADFKLIAKTRADEPSMGHFSVAVIDETKTPVNENAESTIGGYLLLTSDLKGYVEQPNYYFNDPSAKRLTDLDLVMLTHGYRKFEWKKLLNNSYPPLAYRPENAFDITGTATTLMGKPLAKGIISLIKMRDGSYLRDTMDNKGRFHFNNLVFMDSTRFMLQAINAKGKNNTKLTYDGEAAGPAVMPAISILNGGTDQLMAAYMQNNQRQLDDIAQYGILNGRMLKDVTIKGFKKTINSPILATQLVSPEFADQYITPDQMAKGGRLADRLMGVLHGIVIRRDSTLESKAYLHGTRMRVILDGNDTDGDLDEIDGDDVESIEVLKFNSSVGAYSSFAGSIGQNKGGTAGILVITSKKAKGLQVGDIAAVGILPVMPKGFYKAREFYSPKYDHPEPTDNRPDLRTTIFWQPELVTGEDGTATFNFYNADGPGTYRVVIEGIDLKGNIGRSVYRYKVQ